MDHHELSILTQKISSLLITYTPKVITALIILTIGWFIAKLIRRMIEKSISRFRNVDKTISTFLGNVIYVFLLTIVTIVAMSIAGIPTTPMTGAMTGILFGVALSMRSTYNIVASGIILAFSRPFKIGDFVDVGGSTGTVERIGFLFTYLRMSNGCLTEVPNSLVLTKAITNFNATELRRNDISLLLYHDANIELVKESIKTALLNNDLVIKESVDPKKAPIIEISLIDVNGITILVRYWAERINFFKALWSINADLKVLMDNGTIKAAKPQRVISQNSDYSPE